eukprot:4831652-Pleurochrysis_carterae.AAC.1
MLPAHQRRKRRNRKESFTTAREAREEIDRRGGLMMRSKAEQKSKRALCESKFSEDTTADAVLAWKRAKTKKNDH